MQIRSWFKIILTPPRPPTPTLAQPRLIKAHKLLKLQQLLQRALDARLLHLTGGSSDDSATVFQWDSALDWRAASAIRIRQPCLEPDSTIVSAFIIDISQVIGAGVGRSCTAVKKAMQRKRAINKKWNSFPCLTPASMSTGQRKAGRQAVRQSSLSMGSISLLNW